MIRALTTALGCLLLLFTAGCGRPPARHVCAKRCAVASDCCPPGVADCPGEYPQNFACVDGLCAAPHCTTDEHCTRFTTGVAGLAGVGGTGSLAGTAMTPSACLWVDKRALCMPSCATDGDCGLAGACSGRADDGRRYCTFNFGCSITRPCLGNLHCMGGSCRCLLDSDCGSSPKVHCVEGACGCRSDTDCQPSLDVCTDDPRFAYPSGAAAGSSRRP